MKILKKSVDTPSISIKSMSHKTFTKQGVNINIALTKQFVDARSAFFEFFV